MKTRELSLAGFVLAAFGASIAACSAQGTTAAPEPADPGAGSPPVGSAGAQTVATAGAGGGGAGAPVSSSGGAPAAHGGAANHAGAGNTTSFGGAPAAAGAPAAGGAATTTGCVAATGTTAAADLPIDDFEDGDNAILPNGMRKGFWYTYNDGTGTQVPTTTTAMPFTATGVGHSATSLKAALTTGSGFKTWGAGLGVDFNNTPAFSCPYNATAYSGIKFWAKTTATFKAMVQIPATTAKQTTADSATCVSTTMCNDHYYIQVPVSTAWAQFTITFADSTTFKQEGWGTPATFDKAHLLGLQFQVKQAVDFNISLDDLTFF